MRARRLIKDPERYKTVLCVNDPDGVGGCCFGEKCQFAHGKLELRRRVSVAPRSPPAATAIASTPPDSHAWLARRPAHLEPPPFAPQPSRVVIAARPPLLQRVAPPPHAMRPTPPQNAMRPTPPPLAAPRVAPFVAPPTASIFRMYTHGHCASSVNVGFPAMESCEYGVPPLPLPPALSSRIPASPNRNAASPTAMPYVVTPPLAAMTAAVDDEPSTDGMLEVLEAELYRLMG